MQKELIGLNKKKRIILMLIIAILFLLLCGVDGLLPWYYSKWNIIWYAKETFGEDVKYIKKESVGFSEKEHIQNIYVFEDVDGCRFTLIDFPEAFGIQSAVLGYYGSTVYNSYQDMKLRYYKKEIDALVNDMGWEWRFDSVNPLCLYDFNSEGVDLITYTKKWTVRSYITLEIVSDEMDLEKAAELGEKLDKLMACNYNLDIENVPVETAYKQYPTLTWVDFIELDENTGAENLVTSFKFSVSDDARWSKETLLPVLQERYNSYMKENDE